MKLIKNSYTAKHLNQKGIDYLKKALCGILKKSKYDYHFHKQDSTILEWFSDEMEKDGQFADFFSVELSRLEYGLPETQVIFFETDHFNHFSLKELLEIHQSIDELKKIGFDIRG